MFFKNCIVSDYFFDNFEEADILLKDIQKDKPRYIPDKAEFLNYVKPHYLGPETAYKAWEKLYVYLRKHHPDEHELLMRFISIRYMKPFMFDRDVISYFFEDLENADFSINEMNKILNMLITAANETGIWDNKGYSPSEMYKILNAPSMQKPQLKKAEIRELSPNEHCHCGSGKKYGACCLPIEMNSKSTLSENEYRLYIRVWLRLLDYINQTMKVVKEKVSTDPNVTQDDNI